MENTENKSKLSILIIEDHPDQRDLLAIVLQREGYKVVTAANGVEALEKLEQENVHIALSDIMMPKMDGFELINRIRSNSALRHIYMILITARICCSRSGRLGIFDCQHHHKQTKERGSRINDQFFVSTHESRYINQIIFNNVRKIRA